MTDTEIQMRAHRIASEIAKRVRWQQATGTPSVYNIAREVLIDEAETGAA